MLAASGSSTTLSSPHPGPWQPRHGRASTSPTMTQIPTPPVQMPVSLHVPRVGPSRFPRVPFCLYKQTIVLGSAHASLPTHVMSPLVCAELATALDEVDHLSLDHCTAPYISLSRHPIPSRPSSSSLIYFFQNLGLFSSFTTLNPRSIVYLLKLQRYPPPHRPQFV
ncbi:hypothetical protein LX36DRAFT_209359 [Colletotrichum falcatum]|nr:hypothetical protein LX36DRAFT_209359 [Colletotrichum falcatum]